MGNMRDAYTILLDLKGHGVILFCDGHTHTGVIDFVNAKVVRLEREHGGKKYRSMILVDNIAAIEQVDPVDTDSEPG